MQMYDCIPFPWVRPADSSTLCMAGCSSAMNPNKATSRSQSVHVSFKAAPAAALPTGAAHLRLELNGGSR